VRTQKISIPDLNTLMAQEGNKNLWSYIRRTSPRLPPKIRFPNTAAIGVKPISVEGTERLVRLRSSGRWRTNRKNVNLVHKGQYHCKYTEVAFKDWGYILAKREFRDQIVTERESWILGNKEANRISARKRTPR